MATTTVNLGLSLDGLSNVDTTGKANGNTLVWNSGTNKWEDSAPSGGITIGTTPITGGTVGRLLFEGSGNVVQQDSTLFWDNTNKRLGIGATPSSNVRADIRMQGALSTDIGLRVGNSANTANIFEVLGNATALFTGTSGNIFRSTGTSGNCFRGDATTGIGGYFSNTQGISGGNPALLVESGGIGVNSSSGGAWLRMQGTADNQEMIRITQSNGATIGLRCYSNGNFSLGNLIGNGSHTLGIVNGTAPTDTPTGGGYLYVEGGSLKFKGSSDTVTTIAVA